ncbi:carboxylesterase/lipase family protein [Microbulbifer sp. YPW1]|uniref:carboxylesterase/lipase family protein n=1 Tax=Microbulbifer sp. YPW1 TaxID=2745199 RepID=UPI00159AE538|nr:carboxylesterase family protein [Microbulbifer sp. YPW1]QKX17880.1 carboxylesterase family protein [Microbulbifer sp. YPW1]
MPNSGLPTSGSNINAAKTTRSSRQHPVVNAPCGALQGKLDPSGRVQQFLGIPYAQSPVGERRWQPPQKPGRWEGIRDATRYGMPAPQNPSPLFEIKGPNGEEPDSEDCLYLNIYTPAAPQQEILPVMVWIHGGAFYLGSGCQSLYNGKYLAASGRAIVVTLNYRLGALGFLRLRDCCDIPATGNEGLLDQIAALHWVRENIAAFGGNPDNVTLFGESAGAMSIASLFAARGSDKEPLTGQLFHKAIVQSGNPGVFHTPERAAQLADRFCAELMAQRNGKPLQQPPTTREILQVQETLLNAPDTGPQWGHLPFKPVLDRDLIIQSPVDALRQGAGAEVSIMVGSNRDEWNLFSAARPETLTLDDQQIRGHLQSILPDHLLTPLLDHYRRRAESQMENPWPLWSRTWNLMLTDMVFTVPGLRLLKAHRGKRYHYHFAQPLNAQPLLGACHAAELGYVFGTHDDASLQHLYGGQSEPHILSETMRNAWLNFAESGNPGSDWPGFEQGHCRNFGEADSPLDVDTLHELWEALEDTKLHGLL